jgi:leucyl aminopeptidase
MKISVHSDDPATFATALLALPCFDDGWKESPAFAAVDKKLDGQLARIAHEEQWKPELRKTLVVHTLGKLPAERVLLFGLGARKDFDPASLRHLGAQAVKSAQSASLSSTAVLMPAFDTPTANERAVEFLTEGLALGNYVFDRYLTGDKKRPRTVETASVLVAENYGESARKIAKRGEVIASAIAHARDLVNEPAAEITPTRFAHIAEKVAKDKGLTIRVLGPKECRELGMGMFLGVAQGSVEEPRLIHLTWKPKGKKGGKKIVLIGKGVTFDSGGLSLKPSDAMIDMKIDMSGAAAVLSAGAALADLGCAHEVHVISALTENMPSGSSYRLGDVLKSMNGKTVEINNTDAEGRLTLGDAITYAKKECAPDEIYDFATLTGACMVALGPHVAGVMSNDDEVANRWLASAKAAGEEMWRLPLPPRLMEGLKSEVADMRNTGPRYGGALTAGLFLKQFVGDTPWVHVDLAGPASADKEWGYVASGGTGFAVATIVEHLVPRE